MKDNYTIGEIARLYHISPNAIRYYEALGILRPSRSEKGYRLYSIYDTWRLNVIRDMLRLGFSTSDIRSYMLERTVSSTERLLELELKRIEERSAELEEIRQTVTDRLVSIRRVGSMPEEKVQIIDIPPRSCYRIREPFTRDADMDFILQKLRKLCGGLAFKSGSIAACIPLENMERGLSRSYGSVVAFHPEGGEEIPGGAYACAAYRGGYERNAVLIPRMIHYAREAGYKPCGDAFEVVWIDIHTTSLAEEYATELQIPIALS